MPNFVRSCSSLPMLDNAVSGGVGTGNSATGTVTCTPTFGSLPGLYSLLYVSTTSTNWINSYGLTITSTAGGTWTNLGSDVFAGTSGQSVMSAHVFLNTSPVPGSQTISCAYSAGGGSWITGNVFILSSSYSYCTGYQNLTTQGHHVNGSAALNISQVSAANHRTVCFCATNTDYASTFNQHVVTSRGVTTSVNLYSFIGDAPGASGVSFATTANNSRCAAISLDLI